jgi:hypothetical protein
VREGMMNGKRTTVYAIIAMCIVGIALVGFFIFRYAPANESFSELYFENQEQLPNKIRVKEEESFAFTAVSHESNKSSYHYAVKFDDETIKEGTFTLLPQEEKTIDIEFAAAKSSIAFVDSKTDLYTTRFKLDGIAGVTWPGGKTVELMPEGKTVESIALLNCEDDNLILPVSFSYDGTPRSTILLRINPGSKDTFHFSFARKQDVKGKGEEIKTTGIPPLVPLGYDIIEEEQTITNDQGKITFMRKVVRSEYRYQKKKISVEMLANGKEYEIHFWTIVEELTELKK